MRDLIVWAVVAVVVLGGLVALARRLESRRWTPDEFERERRGGTALGNAMLAAHAAFEPGAQHALEQRTVEEADEEESGAPPRDDPKEDGP